MSLVGLFAGIGGFERAFQLAGFESELLCEIDPTASVILRHRFPDATIVGDIRDIDALPSTTSILTAGFPCQDLSMAGNKSGINGGKSGVVAAMFALVAKSRVPTIVLENVNFMLHLDSGRGMLWLVERLEEMGYQWAYRVLDTIGFGLPQRRRRVYLVASISMDPRHVLFADESTRRPSRAPGVDSALGFYWTEGRSGIGLTVDGIPPLKVGSGIGIPSPPAVYFPDGEVLLPSLSACERLQGFASGWVSDVQQPDDRASWRLIGNSVSVPVVKWVANRLREPGKVLDLPSQPLTKTDKWPAAAWNVGQGRARVEASDRPLDLEQRSIQEFRDQSWTRLSSRALDGFIRRAEEGGLRTPDGFLDALRAAPRSLPRVAKKRVNRG